MHAFFSTQPGGPERLDELEVADPPLKPGQVRIATSAVGMNFADLVQLSGDFQIPIPVPLIPGFELAGTVVEVASDVRGVSNGQRVLALVPWGAYTDKLVVDVVHVLPTPDTMTDLQAATFPVSYATAHVSLFHRGRLKRGEVVVVSGATGNVGEAALQLARAAGATTIAVDRNGTLPTDVADLIVPIDDVTNAVDDVTDGKGSDLVLDLVGGDLTSELLRTLKWEGRLVTTGFASGIVPTLSLLEILVANVSVIGEDIAGYAYRDPAVVRDALSECLAWLAEGHLSPRDSTAHAFDLLTARETLQSMADGSAAGKHALLLNPRTHSPHPTLEPS